MNKNQISDNRFMRINWNYAKEMTDFELLTYVILYKHSLAFSLTNTFAPTQVITSINLICEEAGYCCVASRTNSFYCSIKPALKKFERQGLIKPFKPIDKLMPSEAFKIALNESFVEEKSYRAFTNDEIDTIIKSAIPCRSTALRLYLYIRGHIRETITKQEEYIYSAYIIPRKQAIKDLDITLRRYDSSMQLLEESGLIKKKVVGSYMIYKGNKEINRVNAPNIYTLGNLDETERKKRESRALYHFKETLLHDKNDCFMPPVHRLKKDKIIKKQEDAQLINDPNNDWGDTEQIERFDKGNIEIKDN